MRLHAYVVGCLCDGCREGRTHYMIVVQVGDYYTNEIRLYEALVVKVEIIEVLDVRNGYEEEFDYPTFSKFRPVINERTPYAHAT